MSREGSAPTSHPVDVVERSVPLETISQENINDSSRQVRTSGLPVSRRAKRRAWQILQ